MPARLSLTLFMVLCLPLTALAGLFDDLGLEKPHLSGRNGGQQPVPREIRSPATPPTNGWRPVDPAEIRRDQEREQRQIQKIQGEWMAISAPTPVAAPSTTINVVSNTRIFNTIPSNPTNLVVPVARAVMNGAPGTSECMRRSLAILRAARRSGLSDEDRAFLAAQAALAMEGAPLQVIVGERGEDVRQEELRPVISDMGKQLRRMDAADQNRQAAIKRLVQSRDRFSRGPEHKQANAAYAQAARERKEAWKQLETDRQKVEIILLENK